MKKKEEREMFIWSLFYSVRENYFVGEQLADEETGDESEFVVE